MKNWQKIIVCFFIVIGGALAGVSEPAKAVQAVSGTFWPATQPVSWTGSPNITAAISGVPSVAISGSVESRGSGYTGTFFSQAAMTAGTALQLVAPGTNVNGLDVYTMEVHEYYSGVGSAWTVLAKASAPTSISDGDVIMTPCFFGVYSLTSTSSAACSLHAPLRIPAGKGLYLWNVSAATVGVSARSLRYEAL